MLFVGWRLDLLDKILPNDNLVILVRIDDLATVVIPLGEVSEDGETRSSAVDYFGISARLLRYCARSSAQVL